MDGRTDRRTGGRIDGRTGGRTDGQIYRQTHTFFLNAVLEYGSDIESKTIKISKSIFFNNNIAIPFSLLVSLENKNTFRMYI